MDSFQSVSQIIHDYDLKNVIEEDIIKIVKENTKFEEVFHLIGEKNVIHPDYEKLAIIMYYKGIHNNQKGFYDSMKYLNQKKIISDDFIRKIESFESDFEKILMLKNDFNFNLSATILLKKDYLLKVYQDDYVESPQYVFLRVAIHIHDKLKDVIKTYNSLSNLEIIHSSPTLFNCGKNVAQLSSCFLQVVKEDSIDGISSTEKDIADISKNNGGIGVAVSIIRSNKSIINSSQKLSDGIIPFLHLIDQKIFTVKQGMVRPGAACAYIEIIHPEIVEILKVKRGQSENKVSFNPNEGQLDHLNLGVLIPNYFIECVRKDQMWYLFDEKEKYQLINSYGKEYEKLYKSFVEENKNIKGTIRAVELFRLIVECQIERGEPFMIYKDHANYLNQQKNYGMILGSNLCTEIYEVAKPNSTAVCNLASINLSKCLKANSEVENIRERIKNLDNPDELIYIKNNSSVNVLADVLRLNDQLESEPKYVIDYDKIESLTRDLVRNLNKTIDINFYFLKDAEVNNKETRPIGIGISGLHDVAQKIGIPYDSEEFRKKNIKIIELMYYVSLDESCELSKQFGPYKHFKGSPISKGFTQIELYKMWINDNVETSLNWESLKNKISQFGVRNSLLIALMPTVSTSEICCTSSSFEIMPGIIKKSTKHGDFKIINPNLQSLLINKNKWSKEIATQIMKDNGSVKNINCLTDKEKSLFKTAFEIDPKVWIRMAADRAPFVDQGQSLSFYIENPTEKIELVEDLHIYAYKLGLKTGMYYLRPLFTDPSKNIRKNKECTVCN
uniref:ribonucleoside-diphosphate reductase n=1 Tax=viral metagenome TaxID=1070528 RepID=A0A6C0JV42_9ZZZZ